MITNKIACFDFETGSKNPLNTQPLQLSCVMIDSIKLEVIDGSIFNTYIKPVEDIEECKKLGLAPIEQEALDVNKIKLEDLKNAPSLESAWKNYVEYISSYGKTKNQWDQPIRGGYNIVNFDNKIIDRLCEKYGPWDNTWCTQKLHHPIHNIDAMHDIYRWTEGQNFKSISMDSVRKWLGIDSENAHNAKKDVLDCAYLIIKFLRLYRFQYPKINFENSFIRENEEVKRIMNNG